MARFGLTAMMLNRLSEYSLWAPFIEVMSGLKRVEIH